MISQELKLTYIIMSGLRIERILVTCPHFESYIYLVVGNYVSKAQNVAKTQIFEELMNFQI